MYEGNAKRILGVILIVLGVIGIFGLLDSITWAAIVLGLLLSLIPLRIKMQNLRKALEDGNYRKALGYYPNAFYFRGNKTVQSMRELLSALLLIPEGKPDEAEPRIRRLFDHRNHTIATNALFHYGLHYGFHCLLPWFRENLPPKGKPQTVDLVKPFWWYGHNRYYNRILGILIEIPPYLSFDINPIYSDKQIITTKGIQYPRFHHTDAKNELFAINLKPDLKYLNKIFANDGLWFKRFYVRIQEHDPDIHRQKSSYAPGAVFEGAHFVDSWQARQNGILFRVERFRFGGYTGLFYTVPFDKRMDLSFSIYGKSLDRGYPPPLPAMSDLIHSVHLLEPDIAGQKSEAAVLDMLIGK